MCRPYSGHGRPRGGSGSGSDKHGRRRRHDVSRQAERQRGRQAGKQVGGETDRWRGSSQSGREGEPCIRTAARMHGDTRIYRHACTKQASSEPVTDRTRARGTGGRGCGKGRSISSRESPPRHGRREGGVPAAVGAPTSAQFSAVSQHLALEANTPRLPDKRPPWRNALPAQPGRVVACGPIPRRGRPATGDPSGRTSPPICLGGRRCTRRPTSPRRRRCACGPTCPERRRRSRGGPRTRP